MTIANIIISGICALICLWGAIENGGIYWSAFLGWAVACMRTVQVYGYEEKP